MSLFMSPGKQTPPLSPTKLDYGRDGERVQDRDVHELFVPGRVCLFGEHSDWAGSFTRFNADITPGLMRHDDDSTQSLSPPSTCTHLKCAFAVPQG
jgi:hypothetical protein